MYLLLVFFTILIMLHNLRLLDLQRGDGVSFFLARNSAHASTVVLCSMQLPKDVLKVMMLLKNDGSLHYVYWIQ